MCLLSSRFWFIKIIFEFDIGITIRSIFESVTDYFENFSITDPSTVWFRWVENKFMDGSVRTGKPICRWGGLNYLYH